MRSPTFASPKWILASIILVALVMLVLVELHTPHVEGPWYGFVFYRRLPALRVYSRMLLAAIPTIAAIYLFDRIKKYRTLLLLLPMLGAFSAKMVSAIVIDPHMKSDFIPFIVMDRNANSYYIDAVALSNFPGWLADFPQIMPQLNLHSQTKAPGSILFYMAFIKTLGHSAHTALIAGIVIGALATLSIPACYLFLRELGADAQAAFCAASFLALCPGFILFFPTSDPVYPVLSCMIGVTWIRAIRRSSIAYAIAAGVATAAILTISFNVLVFGLFLVGYTLLATDRPWPEKLRIALKHALIAAAACAVLMGLICMISGYDPIGTFKSAWINQHRLLAEHANERPYPTTIWNDLLDFALGSGWISFVLAGFGIAEAIRAGWKNEQTRIVLLAIAQPIVVAITALLASETARVWNFMLPLLILPVGLAMAKQTRTGRIVILCCLALILAADCRNMSFFVD